MISLSAEALMGGNRLELLVVKKKAHAISRTLRMEATAEAGQVSIELVLKK